MSSLYSFHRLNRLPECCQRVGRLWDNNEGKGRAIMTCGGIREVDLDICESCGGFTSAMISKFVEPKRKDDS